VLLGVTQTLPGFLSNAWMALLRHPEEMQRLRVEPTILPAAIEELMRYAGLVHTLVRHASVDMSLGDIRIRQGQRVILKIASANHDAAHFDEPGRLILNRPVNRRDALQLALGAGPHSCVGASFVRIAAIAATRALIERFAAIELIDEPAWSNGPVLAFLMSLPVRLSRS
jgi:cytochrome P450